MGFVDFTVECGAAHSQRVALALQIIDFRVGQIRSDQDLWTHPLVIVDPAAERTKTQNVEMAQAQHGCERPRELGWSSPRMQEQSPEAA